MRFPEVNGTNVHKIGGSDGPIMRLSAILLNPRQSETCSRITWQINAISSEKKSGEEEGGPVGLGSQAHNNNNNLHPNVLPVSPAD